MPKEGGALIFLHGLGDTPDCYWMEELSNQLPTTFPELHTDHFDYIHPCAPTRPISVYNGVPMPGWFDIYNFPKLDSVSDVDREGVLKAVEMVEGEITRLFNEKGIPPSRIVVGGFSQGGAIAMMTAYLRQGEALAGCINLSGWLLPCITNVSKAAQQTPLFWGHGIKDDVIPFALQEQGVSTLQQLGVQNITTKSYSDLMHCDNPEEIQFMAQFIHQSIFRDIVTDDDDDEEDDKEEDEEENEGNHYNLSPELATLKENLSNVGLESKSPPHHQVALDRDSVMILVSSDAKVLLLSNQQSEDNDADSVTEDSITELHLPGGPQIASDLGNDMTTVLRITQEKVGLDIPEEQVQCRLPSLIYGATPETALCGTPFVALCEDQTADELQEALYTNEEISAAVWVPLDFFVKEQPIKHFDFPHDGHVYKYRIFQYQDSSNSYRIGPTTAHLLHQAATVAETGILPALLPIDDNDTTDNNDDEEENITDEDETTEKSYNDANNDDDKGNQKKTVSGRRRRFGLCRVISC